MNLRSVKYLVLLGEFGVLAYLAATEDLAACAFLVMGVAACFLLLSLALVNWPLGAVLLLIGSSAMPKFKGTLFKLHVRPEHVAVAFVAAAVAWLLIRGRRRFTFEWRLFDYFLLAYVALNFFTSALTSPEPRMTLRWAAMNAIVIIPYFLLRLLVKNEGIFFKSFQLLLWVGAGVAAYAIVCFLSNRLFGTEFGMEIGQYGAIPGTYGTQYEPNLLGSYSACCAIMFLCWYLLGDRSRWYGLGCLITVLGAAVSLARSAIIAFPLVAVVVFWIAFRRGQFQIRKFVPLAAAVGLLLLVFSPFLLNMLRERFSTINLEEISSDETTAGRIIQMAFAVQNVQEHPLFGTGTASFQLLFNWEGYLGEDAAGWVSNTPLRILNDTGIVGLSAFLLYIGSLLLTARKAIRLSSPQTRSVLISLLAGLLLYAITFQSSEASLLAFTWVHLGLVAAGATVMKTTASVPLSQ